MTDRRLMLILSPLALLAACDEAPTDDGRAASGEVFEGTISDAMLPLDRLRSEPPLEDPEAFAEVQEEASEAQAESAEGEQVEPAEAEADDTEGAPAEEPAAAAEAE